MDEDNVLDFNFWPSFADMMLALVFVIIVVFVGAFAVRVEPEGKLIPPKVEKAQSETIAALDSRCLPVALHGQGIPRAAGVDTVRYFRSRNSAADEYEIAVSDEAMAQTFTFSESLLFPEGVAAISRDGREILGELAVTLKNCVERHSEETARIRSIAIRGHACTKGTDETNLDLAGERAKAVYRLFKANGVDPAQVVMSAASYGEWVPAKRQETDSRYTLDRLNHDNQTDAMRKLNRRVEIRLEYQLVD